MKKHSKNEIQNVTGQHDTIVNARYVTSAILKKSFARGVRSINFLPPRKKTETIIMTKTIYRFENLQ